MTTESSDGVAVAKSEAMAFKVELASVVLIALTAVLTAWSAFQSSKWGGVMAIDFSSANAARSESVRASNEANRQIAVDVGLFTSYIDAVAVDDERLSNFYLDRFPDRLAVATEAWLATQPMVEPTEGKPETPFSMAEYVSEPEQRAAALADEADQWSSEARAANQTGDNYTVTSVFFATVILIAALSAKVSTDRLKLTLLVGALVVFLATTAVILTYPIEI